MPTSFVNHLYFLSCVCYAYVHVCLFVPCGHLVGKSWPLGSSLWCRIVMLGLHYVPGSHGSHGSQKRSSP